MEHPSETNGARPGSPVSAAPQIVRATKRVGRLRVAITGPSGAGKTYTSLLLAAGIVGVNPREDGTPKVLVVDTENGSAADYGANADGSWPILPFDLVDMRPRYTVDKYEAAYRAAEAGGYEVVIFDSLTHVWRGEGGLLDEKERADARGGSRFSNWAPITEKFNRFRAMILGNRVHLVATMRSKMDYVLDDKGKPTKVGLAPEMRDGMEYEFTTVFDLDLRHQAQVSKDRTGLFAGADLFIPTADTGRRLIEWRTSGAPEQPRPKAENPAAPAAVHAKPGMATIEQRTRIRGLLASSGLSPDDVRAQVGLPPRPAALTHEGAEKIILYLASLAAPERGA
jgi:hypothetical protein